MGCRVSQTQIYIALYYYRKAMNNYSSSSFHCESVGTLTMVNVQQIQRQQNLDYLEHLCSFVDRMKINPLWYDNEQLDNRLKVLQIYQLAINYSKNVSSSYEKQLAEAQNRVEALKASKEERVQRIREHKEQVSRLKLKYKKKKHTIYRGMYTNLKNKLREEQQNGHNHQPQVVYYYPGQEGRYPPPYYPQYSQQHFDPREQPPSFHQPYSARRPQSQQSGHYSTTVPPSYPSGNHAQYPYERRQPVNYPPYIQPDVYPAVHEEKVLVDPTLRQISDKIMEDINKNEETMGSKNKPKALKKEAGEKQGSYVEDTKTYQTSDLLKRGSESKKSQKKSQIQKERRQSGSKVVQDQPEEEKMPSGKSGIDSYYRKKSNASNDQYDKDINSMLLIKLEAESRKIQPNEDRPPLSKRPPSKVSSDKRPQKEEIVDVKESDDDLDFINLAAITKSKFTKKPSETQGQKAHVTKPVRNKPQSSAIRKTEQSFQQVDTESPPQPMGTSKQPDADMLTSNVRQFKFGNSQQDYINTPSVMVKKSVGDSYNLLQSNRGEVSNNQRTETKRAFGVKPQRNTQNLSVIDEQNSPTSKLSSENPSANQAQRANSSKPVRNGKPLSGIIRKTEQPIEVEKEPHSQVIDKSRDEEDSVITSNVKEIKFGNLEKDYLKPNSKIGKPSTEDSYNIFESNRGDVNNRQKNVEGTRVFGVKPQRNIQTENMSVIDEQASPPSKNSGMLKISQAQSQQYRLSNAGLEQSHTTSIKFTPNNQVPQLPKEPKVDTQQNYEGDFEGQQDDDFIMTQMMQSKKPVKLKTTDNNKDTKIDKSEVNIQLTSVDTIKDTVTKCKYVRLVNETFTIKKPSDQLNIPNITASVNSNNIYSSDDFYDQIMEIPENSVIGVRPSALKKHSPSRIVSKDIVSLKNIGGDQSSGVSQGEGGSSFSINLIDPTGNRQKLKNSKRQENREVRPQQRPNTEMIKLKQVLTSQYRDEDKPQQKSRTDMIKLDQKEKLQSRVKDSQQRSRTDMIRLDHKENIESRVDENREEVLESICMDNLEDSVVNGHAHKLSLQQQILTKIRSAEKTVTTKRNPKRFDNKWIDEAILQQFQEKPEQTATAENWKSVQDAFEQQIQLLRAELAEHKKGKDTSKQNSAYNQNINNSAMSDDLKYSESFANNSADVKPGLKNIDPIKEMSVSMEFRDDPKPQKPETVSQLNQYLRKAGEKQEKYKTNYRDKLIIGLKEGSNYDQENPVDKTVADYLSKKKAMEDDDDFDD